MRTPSLLPHLLAAAAVSLAGAWLYHLVAPAAGPRLAVLLPLVGTASFALLATWRSCSEPRFGPVVLTAWLLLVAGLAVTAPDPTSAHTMLTLAATGARLLWGRPRPVRAIAEIALGVVAVAGWRFLGVYRKFRGRRLVECPENEQTVSVNVSAGRAAFQAFLNDNQINLKSCTRWPEKQDCGQDCLSQIHAAPSECLVANIVGHWYEGKACALCGKPIGTIDWTKNKPALMDAERNTTQWDRIPPETLPEVLQSHMPVCWDCHVVEQVYREHSDKVVERPERPTAY